MRSAVEEQLNLIALGRADFYAVLQHTVEIFKQKFHYFVQSIDAMDQLFEVSFSPLSASGKSHSRYDCFVHLIFLFLHLYYSLMLILFISGAANVVVT